VCPNSRLTAKVKDSRNTKQGKRGGDVNVYQTPELLHIGTTEDVVLGTEAVGGDLLGELDWEELEFKGD
jgi:hypothetical protein